MPIEKVNTTDIQSDETNVDWLATGERMTEENLNRPVKQVAEVLNNAIDDIESEFANLTVGTSNALQQEIADRTAADVAEEAARINADNAEQTARINADNLLQSNIDTEIQNRTNADNTLQANIDAEIQNRTNADNTLQANIDDIIANRLKASNISTVDEFLNSNSLNVQDVLDDLDNELYEISRGNRRHSWWWGWATINVKATRQTTKINFPSAVPSTHSVQNVIICFRGTVPGVYSGRSSIHQVPIVSVKSFDNSGFVLDHFNHVNKTNIGNVQISYLALVRKS